MAKKRRKELVWVHIWADSGHVDFISKLMSLVSGRSMNGNIANALLNND